ncbi:TetR/AcrR family transcriptional regulator [Acidaminobacter sp. JC074]|uniref:TetR/AcrR family transcriptional regulator n=1 Tax=Acidaminobacter sp. JC074 TaxID=2530199 RepID=UPI001F0F9F46|nr:TetR/AcrR family transcriptional regulator [Acidaminobacter sp. JC074]MCH4890148.1 TetR/AcrR family transcriptional regulator [Acidaminobacter sp. JC074]
MHTSKKTRQKIIDTAIDLFAEKGYENVSIKEICSKMSFGRSTFYYHFKTKEQILTEYYISDSVYDTKSMSWILTAPNNYERAVRIQLVYNRHLLSIGSDEAIRHFIAATLVAPNEDTIEFTRKVKQLLIPLIQQCQESGEITNQSNPELLCDVAIRIQNGIIIEYFLYNEKKPLEETLLESLNVLYNP